MNREQAKTELRRRLNILSQKKVPEINKVMLRGGMQNINQRKEIGRFKKEIDAEKQVCSVKLKEINNLLSIENENEEPEISLSMFKEPKLRNVKIGRYDWF